MFFYYYILQYWKLILITVLVSCILKVYIPLSLQTCSIQNFRVQINYDEIDDANCNYGFPDLVQIIGNKVVKKRFDYPNYKNYTCCIGSINHADNFSALLKKNKTCSNFPSYFHITQENVYIECTMFNQIPIFEDFYFFLNNRPKEQYARLNANPHSPSVIVLILGEISQNVFHQALPNTTQYLHEVLKAQEFSHLQGHVETYRNQQHLIHGDQSKSNAIWFAYRNAGYATAYGDDCVDTYAKLTPLDVLDDRFYPIDFNWESFYALGRMHIGNQERGRAYPTCLGGRRTFARMLDYIAQYIKLRSDRNPQPLFGVFYIDAFRYHRGNLRHADRHFLHFFRDVSAHLNKDTVMMLVGDNVVLERIEGGNAKEPRPHGNYVKTPPLFYFLLPISYKIEYPDAAGVLAGNAMKMVTYPDIHRTLRDLIKDNRGNVLSGGSGYSLLEKNYFGKTCKSAGIDPSWCLCNNG